MSDMDRYYRLLGLNPGASEEEIREAYKDLVKVWHPDRFANDPQLKEKANKKLKEINLAYEVLKAYIAGKSEQSTASGERRNHAGSQPPPREPSPKPDEGQTTAGVEGHGDFQPPPKQPFIQAPPQVNPTKQEKQTISHSTLMCFFIALGARIGYVITEQTHFSTSNEAGFYVGGICALLGGVGALIAIGSVKVINGMDKPKKHKVRLAWGVAVAGMLLFSLPFALLPSPSSKHGQPRTSSSSRQLSSTQPSPGKEKLPDMTPPQASQEVSKTVAKIIRETPETLHTPMTPPAPPPSSGKLNPLFADIDKTPMSPEGLNQSMSSWKLYAANQHGYEYYAESNITRPSKNMVRVWTKSFFSDKGVISMVGQLGRRFENLSYTLNLLEINCGEKNWRSLTVTYYSKNGDVLASAGEDFEWRFIVPGTVLDPLLKEVCE